jgi:hypothetical protein
MERAMRKLLLFSSLLAASLLILSWSAHGGAQAPEKSDLPFEGKLMLIYAKGRSADFAYTLEDVSIIQIGGIDMLTGTYMDDGDSENWMGGCVVHVAMDAVESIIEFEDAQAYSDAMLETPDGTL